MFSRVAAQDQGERAVAGHIAGRAEAVLQGKDRQHQRKAGIVKPKHARDQASDATTVPPGTPGAPIANTPSSRQNSTMDVSDGI